MSRTKATTLDGASLMYDPSRLICSVLMPPPPTGISTPLTFASLHMGDGFLSSEVKGSLGRTPCYPLPNSG